MCILIKIGRQNECVEAVLQVKIETDSKKKVLVDMFNADTASDVMVEGLCLILRDWQTS